MRIARFEWDPWNKEHLEPHGVVPPEVEEVLRRGPYTRQGRQGRFLAYGPTGTGRLLLVVFMKKPDGVIRVVTARDMTPREKWSYRRRMR